MSLSPDRRHLDSESSNSALFGAEVLDQILPAKISELVKNVRAHERQIMLQRLTDELARLCTAINGFTPAPTGTLEVSKHTIEVSGTTTVVSVTSIYRIITRVLEERSK